MARRRRNGNGNNHGFNLATVVQIGSVMALLGGFYYLTNYRVNENSDDIKAEIASRERVSKEFFDKLGVLNDSLAKLNTNVQVQASVLESIKTTLAARR